jgi:BioD-like phosphotransacetylase family protein
MKALYVTSLQSFSGKTAVCLALGRRLQKEGYKVGYFKPPLCGICAVVAPTVTLCRR